MQLLMSCSRPLPTIQERPVTMARAWKEFLEKFEVQLQIVDCPEGERIQNDRFDCNRLGAQLASARS